MGYTNYQMYVHEHPQVLPSGVLKEYIAWKVIFQRKFVIVLQKMVAILL